MLFGRTMLKSFVDFRKSESLNIKYILQTPIFYNPDITIGNKSVFLKTWFENGVQFIGDLIKNQDDLELYGYEELCNKYNFYPNHLHYIGIVNVVTKYLKNYGLFDKSPALNTIVVFKNLDFVKPFVPLQVISILKYQKGTQPMYNIVKTNTTLPICMSKWTSTFETIESKDWNHIFGMPFSITRDSSLQWFQYRIIHRIIGTNYFLYKIK